MVDAIVKEIEAASRARHRAEWRPHRRTHRLRQRRRPTLRLPTMVDAIANETEAGAKAKVRRRTLRRRHRRLASIRHRPTPHSRTMAPTIVTRKRTRTTTRTIPTIRAPTRLTDRHGGALPSAPPPPFARHAPTACLTRRGEEESALRGSRA